MFSDPDSELALVSLFAALICLNLAAWRLLTHD